jgi:hypothetical protein
MVVVMNTTDYDSYESFTNYLCYSTGQNPEDAVANPLPPSSRRILIPISIENLNKAENPFGNASSTAPLARHRSGRKQKKRLERGSQRTKGPYITIPQRCSKCGKPGHNKRNRGGCNAPRHQWTYSERVHRNKELRHRLQNPGLQDVIDLTLMDDEDETSSIFDPMDAEDDADTEDDEAGHGDENFMDIDELLAGPSQS